MQSLHLCGQVEHRLYQFTSTVVRAYFAREMAWNNPERIAERRRNGFGHLATFRLRLFLVPSLVSNSINWLIKHQSSGYVVQKPQIIFILLLCLIDLLICSDYREIRYRSLEQPGATYTRSRPSAIWPNKNSGHHCANYSFAWRFVQYWLVNSDFRKCLRRVNDSLQPF